MVRYKIVATSDWYVGRAVIVQVGRPLNWGVSEDYL